MNKEQELARKIILETNDNIFITGKAGTGKTTFLRQIVKELSAKNKKYVVLAPTGVAAINAEGSTIHRFFGWKPENTPLKNDKVPIETYQKLDTIIIDEASMLKADLLDRIDLFLKHNNKQRENESFAGVQMVFIGDLYQLPPVILNEKEENKYTKNIIETEEEITNMLTDTDKHKKYDSPYFLSSYALRKKYLHIIEFTEVYRQKEQQFIDILNSVRINNVFQEQLNILNKQVTNNIDPNSQIKLVTTNKKAGDYNSFELAKINSQEYISKAKVEPYYEDNPKQLPIDKELHLKVGAKVMILINDKDKKYVNGSIGKITNLQTEFWTKKDIRLVKKITVKLDNGNTVELERYKWEKYKYVWNEEKQEYEKVEIGFIEQFPLKLAWAVTVHKSQGQTFDTLTIDLGSGAFEKGQVYVALSRCRTLAGISLIKEIQANDIMVDNQIEKLISLQNKINRILKQTIKSDF